MVRQHGTQVLGDEPEYSSCHGRVIATLDYIWYSERAFAPGASAVRPTGHRADSLSSINGWSPLSSIASPMDSIKESSSSASARRLGSPAGSPEGKSSVKSAGSPQTGMLAGRQRSELNGSSQVARGTAFPGQSLPPESASHRLLACCKLTSPAQPTKRPFSADLEDRDALHA